MGFLDCMISSIPSFLRNLHTLIIRILLAQSSICCYSLPVAEDKLLGFALSNPQEKNQALVTEGREKGGN